MEGSTVPGLDFHSETDQPVNLDQDVFFTPDRKLDDYLIVPFPFRTQKFLGLNYAILDQSGVVDCISAWIARGNFRYVVTPNVAHVVSLDRELENSPEIADAYAAADLTVCDSRILAILAGWSGIEMPVVTGSDLTARLLSGNGPWSRIAVVGGAPEMHRRLEALFPQYDWNFHTPPEGIRTDPAARKQIATFVEETNADLTFFAFGAPQSEMCCHEIARRGNARTIVLCVGASLEFVTGMKRRAPLWVQRNRLEWCHRLLSEPSRLWRRYLVECPRIFGIWLRQRADARRTIGLERG